VVPRLQKNNPVNKKYRKRPWPLPSSCLEGGSKVTRNKQGNKAEKRKEKLKNLGPDQLASRLGGGSEVVQA
jgi:hypothetical protein